MSLNHPVAPVSARTSRPGTATAGAIIALVLTSLVVLGCVVVLIAVAASPHDPDRAGRTAAAAVSSVLLIAALVGLAAAIMTLRNSNGWRITTAVLGFVVGAFWILGTVGLLVGHDRRGAVGGSAVMLVWAVLAIASSVLLLVNGANDFYSSSMPAIATPTPQGGVAPGLPPAAWYPVDGSRLQWWNGTQWTEHFHDGHSNDGH